MRTVKITIAASFLFLISFSLNAQSIADFGQILEPKFDLDMSKYPGMHPAQAFELEGYNRLDLPGKIQWTKDAIEAEKKNLEIDLKMGEDENQIQKDKKEIAKLEKQLIDLHKQGEPSV